jgi:hypothetical protein
MKKYLLAFSCIILLVAVMAFTGGSSNDVYHVSGAPAGYAGDPASGGATCRSCHSGPGPFPLTGVITSNIPPAGYTPNTTYTITATFVRPGHSRFGFSISPQNATGTLMGTLAAQSGTTQINGGGKYVTHVITSTMGSGSKTWQFLWTAPASGSGSVTFYGAFNAANDNGQLSGDSIFTSTYTVSENTTGVNDKVANLLHINVFPNPATNFVNVTFYLLQESDVDVSLFDMNGNTIAVLDQEKGLVGRVDKKLDVSSYAEGIYFLRLSVNGHLVMRRVVKM